MKKKKIHKKKLVNAIWPLAGALRGHEAKRGATRTKISFQIGWEATLYDLEAQNNQKKKLQYSGYHLSPVGMQTIASIDAPCNGPHFRFFNSSNLNFSRFTWSTPPYQLISFPNKLKKIAVRLKEYQVLFKWVKWAWLMLIFESFIIFFLMKSSELVTSFRISSQWHRAAFKVAN